MIFEYSFVYKGSPAEKKTIAEPWPFLTATFLSVYCPHPLDESMSFKLIFFTFVLYILKRNSNFLEQFRYEKNYSH